MFLQLSKFIFSNRSDYVDNTNIWNLQLVPTMIKSTSILSIFSIPFIILTYVRKKHSINRWIDVSGRGYLNVITYFYIPPMMNKNWKVKGFYDFSVIRSFLSILTYSFIPFYIFFHSLYMPPAPLQWVLGKLMGGLISVQYSMIAIKSTRSYIVLVPITSSQGRNEYIQFFFSKLKIHVTSRRL